MSNNPNISRRRVMGVKRRSPKVDVRRSKKMRIVE